MKTKQLLLILLAALLPSAAWADVWKGPWGVNYCYTVGKSEASVTISQVSGSIGIISQFTVDGNTYSVTSIEDKAFYQCDYLTSISIPKSVTSIGDSAFYRSEIFDRLTYVEIHNGVKTIGNAAFMNCRGLDYITIPNSVTSIGESAFRGCTGLTNITIPNSVMSIEESAFSSCTNLKSVTIGSGVTSIGEKAFGDCSGLTTMRVEESNTVYDSRDNSNAIIKTDANELISGCKKTVIPNSVTSIGNGAFYSTGLSSITIPESVRSIGKEAFRRCDMYYIEIPNSVTSIGNSAFLGCSKMHSIVIPNSVTSIGDRAFSSCGLETITIPDGVPSIGEGTFNGCVWLRSVTIGSGVTSIGDSAFHYCRYLGSINIPNSVTSIGKEAFSQCEILHSITIPNSVTSIGGQAFYECSGLTAVTIGNSVTNIGSSAFANCSGLTSITIPNSVTSIGGEAFYRCSGLTSLTIGNSVTSIGDYAFCRCTGLTSVTIPNSVTSIGEYAFKDCSSLTSITFPEEMPVIGGYAFANTPWFDTWFDNQPDGLVYLGTVAYEYKGKMPENTSITIKEGTLALASGVFSGCQGLTSITIPNSVTSIGNSAFSGCSGLTSITIPDSVTSIGEYVFSGCSGLTSVKIGNGVTNIKTMTFFGCRRLTSITIPNSVTTIGNSAFEYCSGLTSITIPNSVTSIESYAFDGCSGLTSITIPNSVTRIGSWAFVNCSSLTSVTIGNSVTSIGDGAFYGCSAITSFTIHCREIQPWFEELKEQITEVVIEDEVTSIPPLAFSEWSNLASVTIGNCVTSIGNGAFAGCSSLTSITIPNSVTSIGEETFSGCSGLTSVTIGNSVTSIGGLAFYGCSSLTSVTIPNSVTSIGEGTFYRCSSLTSVTIGNSVTSIGSYAFEGCSGLTSITIPNSVTSIGFYAFEGSGLTSITIPNSVTSIGAGTFAYCSSLASITIPNSVTSIGDEAFYICNGLTSITSYIKEPFPISNVFFGDTYDSATLYVPKGTIDAYKATDGWKNFKKIEVFVVSHSLTLSVTDENGADITDRVSITWYDADGKEIGTGSSLNGIEEDAELYYTIALDEELGRIYREVNMQKVADGLELINCQLQRIEELALHGMVSCFGIPVPKAEVSLTQWLNGKYEYTANTLTDAKGEFSLKAYNDSTELIVLADGYVDEKMTRKSLNNNGEWGAIEMQQVKGKVITLALSYQEAVRTGEEPVVQTWYTDTRNIEYEVRNLTKDADITDFALQQGDIVLPTGVDNGDRIQVTLRSLNGKFADITKEGLIGDDGTVQLAFTLVAYGGIEVDYSQKADDQLLVMLYGSDGKLQNSGVTSSSHLTFTGLKAGSYTLVTMGSNGAVGSIGDLSDLDTFGLVEGADYVMTAVTIQDGLIGSVTIADVPELDVSKFEYTSINTSYLPNKSQMALAGPLSYITLTARVDFKTQFANEVSDVKVVVDVPEGCEFIPNSVVTSTKALPHTLNGRQLTITLDKEDIDSRIRFCMMPKQTGTFTSTAYAEFDCRGEKRQSIGSAVFEATAGSISVPSLTEGISIAVNGIAASHATVDVYDGDYLIGTTTALGDGNWRADVELYKPYNLSTHKIYAKYQTESGIKATTESQECFLNMSQVKAKSVTMSFYNGWMKKNIEVVFDFETGKTSSTNYSFYTATDFTFVADLTANDTTRVNGVTFYVHTSAKEIRKLKGFFDTTQNRWVAVDKFDSYNLPVNISLEVENSTKSVLADAEQIEEGISIIENLQKEANESATAIMQVIDQLDAADENEDESQIVQLFSRLSALLGLDNETDEGVPMSDDEWEEFISQIDLVIENNVGNLAGFEDAELRNLAPEVSENMEGITISTAEGLDEQKLLDEGFEAIQKTDFTFFYVKYDESGYTLVDLANDIVMKVSNEAALSRGSKLPSWIHWPPTVEDIRNGCNTLESIINNICSVAEPALESVEAIIADNNDRILAMQKEYIALRKAESNLGNIVKRAMITARLKTLVPATDKLKNVAKWLGKLKLGKFLGFAGSLYDLVYDARNAVKDISMMNNLIASVPDCETVQSQASQLRHDIERFRNGSLVYYGSSIAADITSLGVAVASIVAAPETGGTSCVGLGASIAIVAAKLVANAVYEHKSKSFFNDVKANIERLDKRCKTKEDEKPEEQDDSNDKVTPRPDQNETVPKDEAPKTQTSDVTATIDPSGYVYEAVPTNRVEGVTATIYYDQQNPTQWDAADFSQVNPQITDETGLYQWDVPQGMWQVRFEKSGYETTQTDWLPVPPPQLEINIPISHAVAPQVMKARGMESGITLDFSKYMKPATLEKSGRISATVNGKNAGGDVELLNLEEDPYNQKEYASKVKFVPSTAFKTTDEVIITVKKEVESYADKQMDADFVAKVKIEPEIKGFECDSLIAVDYRGNGTMEIAVLPAAAAKGRTVRIASTSPMIATADTESVVLDNEGKATVNIDGKLPGGASMHLQLDDTDIEKYVEVNVVLKETVVKMPKASKRSGSTVEPGYLLSLTCNTPGATIYYTLDGSCPCDEKTRKKYTAPFPLPLGDVTVKAIAVRDGMDDSDIATFVYNVIDITNIKNGEKADADIDATYADGQLTVTGTEGCTVRVYDLLGRELTNKRNAGRTVSMKLPQAEGYIVAVTTKDGQTMVRKVTGR